MDTIYYVALGTAILIGLAFFIMRFMDNLNKWKQTKKDRRSGWIMDRNEQSAPKGVLRISNYHEIFQEREKEATYRDNINSHLL